MIKTGVSQGHHLGVADACFSILCPGPSVRLLVGSGGVLWWFR